MPARDASSRSCATRIVLRRCSSFFDVTRLTRYDVWMTTGLISCFFRSALNSSQAATSYGVRRNARGFPAKIWIVSQPFSSASATVALKPLPMPTWTPNLMLRISRAPPSAAEEQILFPFDRECAARRHLLEHRAKRGEIVVTTLAERETQRLARAFVADERVDREGQRDFE